MGTVHSTHIHSKYHEDVKVGFVDADESESLLLVKPNQTRRIQDTKHGKIFVLLYLKNPKAGTQDGFDHEPTEKMAGSSDMSFIISNAGQIVRAKYGTVAVEEILGNLPQAGANGDFANLHANTIIFKYQA